jgi:protein-tyrosine phosphatase
MALIDLHAHILPAMDDGSPDMETSLDMARVAVADGIVVMACTPHVMPGIYQPTADEIATRYAGFQLRLQEAGIPLDVVAGCEAHSRPDFIQALTGGQIPTLNNSRYVLYDPPRLVTPPRLEEMLYAMLDEDYVPVLTSPENLKWIESHFEVVQRLVERGVWLQLTAGSLSGRHGRQSQYWAERLLEEGMVHILASDAHNLVSRPPILSEAYELARVAVGTDEALNLVCTRPVNILDDEPADSSPSIAYNARRAKEPHWLWPRYQNAS